MLIARGMPARLLVGGFATALFVATSVSFPTAPAAEGIDEIITGSLGHAPVPAAPPVMPLPPAVPASSDDFTAALSLVTDGKFTDAYGAAAKLKSDLERRTVEWAAIYYGNGTIPYDQVRAFEQDAPDFVSAGVFKTRIEQALLKADASDDTLISTLAGSMPNTLNAQLALAKAYADTGKKDRAAAIARDIWINNVLDPATEKKVLGAVGDLLSV